MPTSQAQNPRDFNSGDYPVFPTCDSVQRTPFSGRTDHDEFPHPGPEASSPAEHVVQRASGAPRPPDPATRSRWQGKWQRSRPARSRPAPAGSIPVGERSDPTPSAKWRLRGRGHRPSGVGWLGVSQRHPSTKSGLLPALSHPESRGSSGPCQHGSAAGPPARFLRSHFAECDPAAPGRFDRLVGSIRRAWNASQGSGAVAASQD